MPPHYHAAFFASSSQAESCEEKTELVRSRRMDLKLLQRRFPSIPWAEPIKVSPVEDPGQVRYACRVCIANQGLAGSSIPSLPTDPEIVRQHLRSEH